MKSFTKNCSLTLRTTSGIVCAIEILFSLAILALLTVFWTMDSRHPTMFYYEAKSNDTFVTRQISLEACVISWSLCILLFLSLWRIVSALVLFVGVGKDSSTLSKYWIVFKTVALVLSIFIAVVSFTSPRIEPSALVSFGLDLVTSYFIIILYPELHRMDQGVGVPARRRPRK